MELTLDQALQKGVEAHKAGKVQEADRYYTAILKANPKHPDANHNMGVLAVGIGKVNDALPFFKTALDANQTIAQFWLSYIDALIKLDRMADAKAAFEQAKSEVTKGDGFEKLEQILSQPSDLDGDQTNEETLARAVELRESGRYDEAINLLLDKTKQFPKDPNLPALLSQCYILNDDMDQAAIFLGQAKNINPDIASVGWNETRLLLKQKKMNDALAVAQKTNKLFPNDEEGLGVLGSCLRVNGNFDESLNYLNKAIELNPNYAEALINRGLVRLAQKDKSNALYDLEKAHQLKPHIKQIWDFIITLYNEENRYQDAIKCLVNMIEIDPFYQKNLALLALCNQKADDSELAIMSFQRVLEILPENVSMLLNLGIAMSVQGDHESAIKQFKKALSINPDFTEAYNSMGSAVMEQGKLDEAIEAYQKAVSIKPDYAQAYYNMGNALRGQGKLEEAIEAYDKALCIMPDLTEAYNNMGIALRAVNFKKPNTDLQRTIAALLDKKRYIRPIDISRVVISLLKLEPQLKKQIQMTYEDLNQNPLDVISHISTFPLLLKLMSICPLPDLDLERLLKNLRRSVLKNILSLKDGSPELLAFQSALALQCFTNEYVYNSTDEEEKDLRSLEKIIKNALKNNEQPSPQVILALASYKALNQYEWCNFLVATDEIKEVFNRQVSEPAQEEKLKKQLPILKEITDKISSMVRGQYEESPYPRWVHAVLHLQSISISKAVDEIKLKLHDNNITKVKKPDILIAGCGTGQHSIETAAKFKGSNVLAIDLSLTSLAYAKRKINELMIENIDFIQADILDLAKLDRQFDIIESVGVLHHMDNPMAGWKVITDCLKPSGLIKIGLYSELARQNIVKIREEIKQRNTGSSDAEMRSFRNMIMESDKDHHSQVLRFPDFYSLNELRDLLFHVQEHRFTIPKIRDHLDKLGLKFCGFETEQIVSHFKRTNKGEDDLYDLEKWKAYEEANPTVFAGMYQFWCQKID